MIRDLHQITEDIEALIEDRAEDKAISNFIDCLIGEDWEETDIERVVSNLRMNLEDKQQLAFAVGYLFLELVRDGSIKASISAEFGDGLKTSEGELPIVCFGAEHNDLHLFSDSIWPDKELRTPILMSADLNLTIPEKKGRPLRKCDR